MPSLSPHASPLGHRLASHLLRRTTFALNRPNIDEFAAYTPQQAIDILFAFDTLQYEEPFDYETGDTWINSGSEPSLENFRLSQIVQSWWMNEAVHDSSTGHKLEFFWHTIFPTDQNLSSEMLFDHLGLLRYAALNGNFKTLAKKVVHDNSMLIYLDNRYNVKDGVNENFAREFLELHTILKGPEDGPGSYTNYTEEDIIAAAKLLTGWRVSWQRDTIDADTGIPTGYPNHFLHDDTDKQFSDKFQNQIITGAVDSEDMHRELNDFIDMIFNQRATAENFVRRLYRFFVRTEISTAVETDIIQPLSDDLLATDYNMIPVLRKLLASEHFYDVDNGATGDEIVGSLIRSPLDMFFHIMNTFYIYPPEPVDTESMQQHYLEFYIRHFRNSISYSGMDIHLPPSVAGYPSYHQQPNYSRLWFSSATIIGRFSYPDMFLESKYIGNTGNLWGYTYAPFDIAAFIKDSGFISNPEDGEVLVNEFLTYVLAEMPDADRVDYFLSILLDDLSLINWMFEWQNYVDTNDASAVEIALKRLFRAVLYSVEYQLM